MCVDVCASNSMRMRERLRVRAHVMYILCLYTCFHVGLKNKTITITITTKCIINRFLLKLSDVSNVYKHHSSDVD